MKKVLIFSFVFALILVFASNFVYASGIDMNLSSDPTLYGSDQNANPNANTSIEGNSDQTAGQDRASDQVTNPSVSVASTASLSSSSLGLSNILNIILIVLGILLILFAIAILIRMR